MISVSLYNPVRFMNIGDFDFLQNVTCGNYLQKWQYGDTINLQLLADEVVTVTVHDLLSKQQVYSRTAIEIETGLIGAEFLAYEISINLSDKILPQGFYYLQIKDSEGSIAISYPFELFDSHPDTILLRYFNSENKEGIIFETGIEFDLRIEGAIFDYSPMSDSEVYFDQSKNPVLLNSVPFRQFNLNLGRNKGISSWMADTFNYAFSCDNKRINGYAIERNEGSDFEPVRVDNVELMGMNIEIVPKQNKSAIIISNFSVLGDNDNNAIVNNNNFIGNGH